MAGPTTLIPPIEKPTDLANFQILVDGKSISEEIEVLSFSVKRAVNKVPSATLLIRDGNVAKQEFEISASENFVPGKIVEIQTGYNNSGTKTIFKGIVTSQSIKLRTEQVTQLLVEIKDIAVKTTVGRKNKLFFDKNDQQIIEEILNTYSGDQIKKDIQAPAKPIVHKEMVQYFCSDWDFILSRADAIGQLVFVKNGEITIATPELSGEAKITLSFGENVYNFEAQMDARNEFEEIIAKSWDDAERKITEKTSKNIDSLPKEGNIESSNLAKVIGLKQFPLQHTGNLQPEELDAWATSKLLRSRLSKIQGRAKVNGYSGIYPGDIIQLENFSPRFNGPAFVSGVFHQLSENSSWYTDIQFGFSQEWFAEKYTDIIETPAAGLLPAVNGLVIGVVLEVDNGEDPDGNHRVKVKLPLVDNGNNGIWARVSTLDAGKERGSFFRPDVGDEVIIGFLNDDPRQPILLGALHSKNDKGTPPIVADKDNYKRGFFTKTGLQIVFDDEKEKILIATKDSKNSIEIVVKDEAKITIKDENKNTIEMSKDGIKMESAKDFIITAKGDIKIDGVNISEKAKSQYKAEGNSGAEISSSGSTVVKGSVVQIN